MDENTYPSVPFLYELYRHMEWADALVWQVVRTSGTAAADEFLLDTLVHLHLTQHAFLQVWRGEGVTMRKRGDFDTVSDIVDWARRYHERVDPFLRGLDPLALGDVLEIPWAHWLTERFGREPEPVRLGDTLYQVAAHSVHHRAQVVRRIREIGGEPPLVDYIAWLWLGRPTPRWPG